MEVQPWQTPFSSIPAALQDTEAGVPTSQGYMEGPKNNNNKSPKVCSFTFKCPGSLSIERRVTALV